MTITATAADGSKKSGKLIINVVAGADNYSIQSLNGTLFGTTADSDKTGYIEPEEDTVTAEGSAPADEMRSYADEAAAEEISGLRFAVEAVTVCVGESLKLDVLNPDDEGYMIALSESTTAAIDAEADTVTGLAEGEITAFLADSATVEIADQMVIHVVKEAPLSETADPEMIEAPAVETAEVSTEEIPVDESQPEGLEEAGEVMADEETGTETGGEEETTSEPAEASAENTSETEGQEESGDVPVVEETGTETGGEEETTSEPAEASAENTSEPEGQEENGVVSAADEAETEISGGGGTTSEPAETSEIELKIRDLTEAGWNGIEGTVLRIERDRFQVTDDELCSLVFQSENEWVVKPVEQNVYEILTQGIELNLLTAGETELKIGLEGEEPLLTVRIVVEAAPSTIEPAAAPEMVPETVSEAPAEPVDFYESRFGEEPVYAPEPEPEPVDSSESGYGEEPVQVSEPETWAETTETEE